MDRNASLASLRAERFDLLVVGGGATGAGVALDAAARGLRTALIERDDFASGTSSRSTKLVHGGVRYLEAAVTQLDRAQFHLVREALAERAVLLHIAPHLARPLRTVVPVYSPWQAAFFRAGLWLYDRAAGGAALGRSRFLSRAAMGAAFPALRRRGLLGGVAYWDGQFDDARMVVSLLVTAEREGATVASRVAATGFLREGDRLTGVAAEDRRGGARFPIRARVVVNATGPGSDALRRAADPGATPLMAPSRGTHIALARRWAPAGDGLLIPKTRDGRVLFLLPWQDGAIAGTTDVASAPDAPPEPAPEDIDYLLQQLGHWLEPAPSRADIRAAWAGLRPLIGAAAASSAQIVREHHVEVPSSGLISIAGGKWTTYRLMAEETVDHAVAAGGLAPLRPCTTRTLLLAGAAGWRPSLGAEIATAHHLDADIAEHLAGAYGDRAPELLAEASDGGSRRLAAGHPWIEAEVGWAVRHEMALDADDILARRTRLAFVDAAAATAARPRVEALLDAARKP